MSLPVNTPGYAAQAAATSYDYSQVSSYLKKGFIYVWPGLRGRDSETSTYTGNAPWGVTDLKAAIRYIRYNASSIPGDKNQVYVFGMSGGGAQSAIAGASGGSALYTPYLDKLGAAGQTAAGSKISDTVDGVMAWVPITNLDSANAAYEWNMGQFATTGTRASGTWTKQYSNDLATQFATYINSLGLKDSSGNTLKLDKSSSGIYLSGSYYDYIVGVVQTSLNNFLSSTAFPYTPTSQGGMGGGGSAPSGSAPTGTSGSVPSGSAPSGSAPTTSGSGTTTSSSSSSSSSTTYKTASDYIKSLNSSTTWVKYNSSTKKATVLNLAGFVKSQKTATKDVGAFDGVTANATENTVMGLGSTGLHFSTLSEQLISANEATYAKLSNWSTSDAASNYTTDFAKTDAVGETIAYRMNMYNPMYYLFSYYKGYGTSTVAKNWRIRTGIMQGDTALTTETDLSLALQNYGVKNVDFATIWGESHTTAETGSANNSTANFIS